MLLSLLFEHLHEVVQQCAVLFVMYLYIGL